MSNLFSTNPRSEHRQSRVSALAFTSIVVTYTMLLTGLGLMGGGSAHASQGPSRPNINQQKQKPLKSQASLAPPDLVSKLSHTGTGPFAPGSQVTFTLQVSNAATAGP